jgi:hypothetical protein
MRCASPWPNGATQGEFDLKGDTSVGAEQRLTGSCPFLWTFDGKGIHFVKDVNWRSPLGLKINAQDTAGVVQTEDWAKIRADQLAPRDGFYDLRITADLWEAHIFDHIALLAVDHPENTEVWVDERFSIPMPPLRVTVTDTPQPITRATDERGQDVTHMVSSLDSRYLDTFGKGRYQGVTRDHWVEVELPQRVLANGPLWLIAEGWLHPTDSSINVALGQGKNEAPRDLSLEVADGKGGWIVAQPHLGFPAGKNKAILIDLKKRLSSERAAQVAPAHESGNLLGQAQLGHGAHRCGIGEGNANAAANRAARLSWRFADSKSGSFLAGVARRLRKGATDATLARSGRLLYAFWRCETFVATHRRPLRHHERR